MKVGIAALRRPMWPKWDWIEQSFRSHGHETVRVTTLGELVKADRECDAVLFDHREPGMGRKRIGELSKSKHSVWVAWWFDLFLGQVHQPLIALYGDLNRCMDLVLVKERSMLHDYRDRGINAEWFDQGVPDDYPALSHRENPEFDVLVFGTTMPEYQQRHRDVQALVGSGFRVGWASDENVPENVTRLPWTHPNQLPDLMSRGAFVLSVDLRHDIEGFRSDRFWLAVGAGACVLKRATPGDPDVPCLRYDELNPEVLGRVRTLVGDVEGRRSLGRQAREAAMEHTYGKRVQELVNRIKVYVDKRKSLS